MSRRLHETPTVHADTGASRRTLLGRPPVRPRAATAAESAPTPGAAIAGRSSAVRPVAGATKPTAAFTRHLLRRTTFGLTPQLVAEVPPASVWDWLHQQMRPAEIPDAACEDVVARFPGLDWSITKVTQEVEADRMNSWDLMGRLVRASLARAVWSRRQFHEVMVEFWSNHFNVPCPMDRVWDNRAHYDAAVIRPLAFGRFADLLKAVVGHPAMLRYLNNDVSSRSAPNENLGRELLELHTVGVGAGYTETDVKNSARILTGFGVDWTTGEPVYRPTWHWTGPVSVLGFTSPNATTAGGPAVLAAYLDHLARHPATARRIATKLAVRFVADEPPAALVSRLMAAYLDSDTAIVPVLEALFTSREFAASAGGKLRRPLEDMAATIRTLGLRPDATGTKGIEALTWWVGDLGQAPFGWPSPDGYPDVAARWQSAAGMVGRWSVHLNLAAGWWPTTLTRDPLASLLPSPLPATHGKLVDALAARLLFGTVTSAQRAAVCRFLEVTPSTPLKPTSAAVTWRLPAVVALVLDAAQHAER